MQTAPPGRAEVLDDGIDQDCDGIDATTPAPLDTYDSAQLETGDSGLDTPTDTPVETDTPTESAAETDTPVDTPTDTPTDTPVDTPTDTPAETDSPTDTPDETDIPVGPEKGCEGCDATGTPRGAWAGVGALLALLRRRRR